MTTTPNGTLNEATSVDVLCEVAIVGVFSNTTGYAITIDSGWDQYLSLQDRIIPLPTIPFASISSIELVITTEISPVLFH